MSAPASPSPNAHKLRMALVFRADLPEMHFAKSEIQAAHAACDLAYRLCKADMALMDRYMAENQMKLNYEVDSLDELLAIEAKAKQRGVPQSLIQDAAHTVFKEPTTTCLILGPMTKTDGNALLRNARRRGPPEPADDAATKPAPGC